VYLANEQRKKKRLAFFQSSVIASPESSPYYPPLLNRVADADVCSNDDYKNTPPKLHKEATALLSSPDSSPCLPPPVKKAKPLIFSDESPSSSQTSLASEPKNDVVDFKAMQQRVHFLSGAFPEVPKQVAELLFLYGSCIKNMVFTDPGKSLKLKQFCFPGLESPGSGLDPHKSGKSLKPTTNLF